MADLDAPAIDFALKERAMDEAPVGIAITDNDRTDNPLIYVNAAFERITGYSREEALGRNCRFLQGPETRPEPVARLREGVETGEQVTVELRNYRKNGELFWNEVTVAPIRDEAGEITNFVGFQADVSRRKNAELALAAEREHLDTVFDRVDRLLDVVTTALVTSTTRPELEQSVCEGLVAAGPYEAAWFGSIDPSGETVVPSASAGPDATVPEAGIQCDADSPVARAVRTGTIQGLDSTPAGASHTGSSGSGGNVDEPTTIALPLKHRQDDYGVLTIVVEPSIRVDDRESTVLTALARAIASGISVLETRRILLADEVVEVELSVSDPALFFVRITDELDCRMTFEGAVADADAPSLFFTVYGSSPSDVREAAASCADLATVSTVSESDEAVLFEFELATDALVGQLAAFGAETRSIVAENGSAVVTFTMPANGDLRSLVERVGEDYAGTDLRSTTNQERPPETRQEYFARVESSLTTRQLSTLQTAYVGGYFDRPRRATGDELAESMGLTRSTFHQHLRVAQQKLFAEFFER